MTQNKFKYWTRPALAKAAQALYGPVWQTKLAKDLNVDPRTVRRWASGEANVPAYVKLFFASGMAT